MDESKALMITTSDGRRYSFRYICCITDRYLSIERLKCAPIWTSLTDEEKQRLTKLFDKHPAWWERWLDKIPSNDWLP